MKKYIATFVKNNRQIDVIIYASDSEEANEKAEAKKPSQNQLTYCVSLYI